MVPPVGERRFRVAGHVDQEVLPAVDRYGKDPQITTVRRDPRETQAFAGKSGVYPDPPTGQVPDADPVRGRRRPLRAVDVVDRLLRALECNEGTVRRDGDEFEDALGSALRPIDGALRPPNDVPFDETGLFRPMDLIERSFEEERRRSKIIRRFTDGRSAVKLVFAVLIRCSEQWQRVAINDIERALRRELGLDPPPGGTGEERSYVERKTVA
jgi:hypothetical protein